MSSYTVLGGYQTEASFHNPRPTSFRGMAQYDSFGQITVTEQGIVFQNQQEELIINKSDIKKVSTVKEIKHPSAVGFLVILDLGLLVASYLTGTNLLYTLSCIFILDAWFLITWATSVWLKVEFTTPQGDRTLYFSPFWGKRRSRWTILEFQDVKYMERILNKG
jgi:hypothetical protein